MNDRGDGVTRREAGTPVPRFGRAAAGGAPKLALVSGGLRLAEPAEPVPSEWRAARDELLAWLGIEAAFVPARSHRRLPATSECGRHPAAAGVPVFAPWSAWCPTAFQNGGAPGLPAAQFVAGYCLEHARAAADPRRGGTDIMLLSPHPSACTAEQGEGDALPRARVMRAMIRAAVAEGRERIAVLVPARHRAAVARLRLGEDARLCPLGVRLEIHGIEEALPVLIAAPGAWDAIIAMPGLRGIVFALIAEATGVRGPWPLLWHADGLALVTAEALDAGAGTGAGCLPLDAAVLVHALALALREAGCRSAAARLHEGWARLRDSGIATPARGDAAPYVTRVPEAEFLALLCRDAAASRRPQAPWRALENKQMSVSGNPGPGLRIVSSNLASS